MKGEVVGPEREDLAEVTDLSLDTRGEGEKDDERGVLIPWDVVEHGLVEFRPLGRRVDAEHVVSVKVEPEDVTIVAKEFFKYFLAYRLFQEGVTTEKEVSGEGTRSIGGSADGRRGLDHNGIVYETWLRPKGVAGSTRIEVICLGMGWGGGWER